LPVKEPENQLVKKRIKTIKKEFLHDMNREIKKRAAIYARVSTFEKGQDPETQLHQLRQYAKNRGFEAVKEYVDFASVPMSNGSNTRKCSTRYENEK
jgi:predicted site-specific integrase-resolvase